MQYLCGALTLFVDFAVWFLPSGLLRCKCCALTRFGFAVTVLAFQQYSPRWAFKFLHSILTYVHSAKFIKFLNVFWAHYIIITIFVLFYTNYLAIFKLFYISGIQNNKCLCRYYCLELVRGSKFIFVCIFVSYSYNRFVRPKYLGFLGKNQYVQE